MTIPGVSIGDVVLGVNVGNVDGGTDVREQLVNGKRGAIHVKMR